MTITAEKDQYTYDGCQRKLPFEAFASGRLDSVSGDWFCSECERKAREQKRLQHLLTLARRGKQGHGASNAERQAYAIVRSILQNVPGLDGDAKLGIAMLIDMTAAAPQATADAVNDVLSPRRSLPPVRARIAEVRP